MSKSIHITIKNFRGLTKLQINKQASEPNSELSQWKKKSDIKKRIKKRIKKERRNNRKEK